MLVLVGGGSGSGRLKTLFSLIYYSLPSIFHLLCYSLHPFHKYYIHNGKPQSSIFSCRNGNMSIKYIHHFYNNDNKQFQLRVSEAIKNGSHSTGK